MPFSFVLSSNPWVFLRLFFYFYFFLFCLLLLDLLISFISWFHPKEKTTPFVGSIQPKRPMILQQHTLKGGICRLWTLENSIILGQCLNRLRFSKPIFFFLFSFFLSFFFVWQMSFPTEKGKEKKRKEKKRKEKKRKEKGRGKEAKRKKRIKSYSEIKNSYLPQFIIFFDSFIFDSSFFWNSREFLDWIDLIIELNWLDWIDLFAWLTMRFGFQFLQYFFVWRGHLYWSIYFFIQAILAQVNQKNRREELL